MPSGKPPRMNPNPADVCELLPWDTEFFGLRIARLRSGRLNPERVAAVEAWCQARKVRCLYFLADADDPATQALAAAGGYHLVDIRMSFERPPQAAMANTAVRPAVAADGARLAALVRQNAGDSRFSVDRNFPPDAGARLHQRWLEKNLADPGAAVFVTGPPGDPGGYVTCELAPGGHGKIGLLGLAPEHRGRGLALALVGQALDWFHSAGCGQASVVTQGRNLAAQRLYERAGFLRNNVQLWYHKWNLAWS